MDRMPSVMSHNFSEVPRAEIQRSSFNRSHGFKCTFDAGKLIPVYVDEALPGDTFKLEMTGFGRMATPLFPLMDNAYLSTFFFACPVRLIWDNWQRFHGEQDNPGDSTDFLVPTVTPPAGGWEENSIADYFGLPTKVDHGPVNALHFRAFQLIFNEWFRDENLINSYDVQKGDGPDDPVASGYITPPNRGKRHDYFTSCLPFPQKGPSVDVPIGTEAPVAITGRPGETPTWSTTDGSALNRPLVFAASVPDVNYGQPADSAGSVVEWANPQLDGLADLTGATAATINQLREAFQVQRIYERDARAGTRYTEIIRGHFGVTSPDARLQRPEYLGGGRTQVNINPVAQTTQTLETGTPQGNLAAFGTVHFNRHGFTKSFTEHMVLIGLICVNADLTYQQGINRMWSRQTRFDFYYPALAHLGEQAVLSKEIFADGTAGDEDVFGYQERFAEYRYKPSTITGAFRSNAAASLDAWHLSQEFATRPVLNNTFIIENPPFDRVIAVPSEPHFIFDSYFKLHCTRPMPIYSVPGMIDHF